MDIDTGGSLRYCILGRFVPVADSTASAFQPFSGARCVSATGELYSICFNPFLPFGIISWLRGTKNCWHRTVAAPDECALPKK